jgi:homocysteine S-methyltransferase
MASFVPELIKEGAKIIGGCCGTTPEHIRLIREKVDSWQREN